MFRFYSCKFKNEKCNFFPYFKDKSHTARVFIQDNFAIDVCYTIEASMGLYVNENN